MDNFKNEVSSFCNRVKSLHNQLENMDDDDHLNNLRIFMQVLKYYYHYYLLCST